MQTKKRVFVIDDDEAVLSSLCRLLLHSGFEVDSTQKSQEALPKIKAFKPDIIILDLLMSKIGGMELCQAFNDDVSTRGIPVIVVSALAKEVDIKKAYGVGVVSYMVKPYEFQELVKEINKILAYKEKT